jgi:hypothetical protein
MNIHKMIADLQAEKERLDEAIAALEKLADSKPRRRSKQSNLNHSEHPSESESASPSVRVRSTSS